MLILTILIAAQVQSAPIRCGTYVFDALRPAELVPQPALKDRACPPQVGETRLMWLQNMSVMPPQQFAAEMTCRAAGPHCYVMVHDSVWDAGIVDSADVARIVERFEYSSPRDSERGVWYHNTTVLGQPPDAIDNDSAIYLLYYNIGQFHGYQFDGFWQFFDQYYDTTAMRLFGYHSNEVECIYLDCYPANPAGDYRIAIAAHEFGHMIHWNYDPAESLWVAEGCCELAMWLFGSPDPISGFNTNPDNDLTSWNGQWADYIKTYLFFLYLYEQYGGRVGTDLIHNIVAAPQASIEGVDSGFAATGRTERFEDVLDAWVLANIINDTAYFGGRYGYYGERVPRFGVTAHSTYPVARNVSLQRWAGEYIRFRQGRNLELTFDGADEADFRLYLVSHDSIGRRMVLDTLALDSLQYAAATVPGFDTAYQTVYLVPVSHYPWGTTAYSYTAAASGLAEPGHDFGPSAKSGNYPKTNLVRAGKALSLPGAFRLFSAAGSLVRQGEGRLTTSELAAGVYRLDHSGRHCHLVVIR